MIHFLLECKKGHEFEGWFASSAAYEAQQGEGSVACPICGDSEVHKRLMAPAIASAARKPVKVSAHTESAEAVAMLRKLRNHLTENAEYVGPRFAEEARRIHYDEAEKRGIYGEAAAEDVRSLLDEGIQLQPLPMLPEDYN